MLYRKEQVRRALYFVDYQQTLVPHEQAWIFLSGRRADRRLIKVTQLGSREVRHREPRERTLTGLPGAIENHDSGVSKGCADASLGMAREEVHHRRHSGTLPALWSICRLLRGGPAE